MTDSTQSRPAGDPERPATDAEALERLKRFGGGKLLDEMISLYLGTAPERLAAVRTGLDARDAAATELALHSLKSSSAQLGALRMQRLCERGEKLAHDGSLDAVVPLLQDLDNEFPRVKSWLDRARPSEAV